MLTARFSAMALASMRAKFGNSATHAARNASTTAAPRSSARAPAAQTSAKPANVASRMVLVTNLVTSHRLHDLLRGIVEVIGREDVELRFGDDLFAELDIGALE